MIVDVWIERVRDLPACFADLLAHASAGLVEISVCLEVNVAGQLAGAFLDFALDLLSYAFDLLLGGFLPEFVHGTSHY